ncbi:UV radiation resistance-associated gene protein isoform X2 [Anabrus simplex]
MVTVWGVYFSGLIYIGPKLCPDPSSLCLNTIVLHMQGGYFTAPHCFKETVPKLRHTKVSINSADVRPSYSVNLLSRLHTIQQAIKKQMLAAESLREKIAIGGYTNNEHRENAVLRRLLNKTRPRAPQRQELLKIRRELESTKFRVDLLLQERARKQKELSQLEKAGEALLEANQDRGSELMNKYQNLHKEMEGLKEWRKNYIDTREAFLHTNAQLIFRRKQLISELNQIYPITQISDGKYAICGVHLPNSEDFAGHDEVMISVALGFVTHVIQMISIFLQVPLRYPVIYFGSRSKIIDHVVEKIPEKDREFPLFSRGKDKLQFSYGVYLLNKNIAQLRWYCGLPTHDLRTTLSNLMGLLHLRPGPNMLETYLRTPTGSSCDLRSSQNRSPVSSIPQVFRKQPLPRQFEKGHRVSKSMGSSELKFQTITVDPEVQSAKDFIVVNGKEDLPHTSATVTTSLSYSLDKGLDEYEEIKRAEDTNRPTESTSAQQRVGAGNLGHVGSEPILTPNLHNKVEQETVSSGDEAQKRFLQNWQAGGSAPVWSDDDLEAQQQSRATHLEGKQSSCLNLDINKDVPQDFQKQDCSTKSAMAKLEQVHDHGFLKIDRNICDIESSNSLANSNIANSCRFPHKLSPESPPEPHRDSDLISEFAVNDVIHIPLSPVCDSVKSKVELEEIADLIDSSLLVDSIFANVTSRTEALASRSGSFNLVRSRHGSMLEDGPS